MALPRATLERGVLWIRGLVAPVPATLVAVFPGAASLRLAPPTDYVDAPLTTRSAQLPAELHAALSRVVHASVIELRSERGDVLGSVALAAPPPAEFCQIPLRIGAPGPQPESSAARGGQRGPHPASRGVLLGSLALLGVALLIGLKPR